MKESVRITSVERDGDDGLIVAFSDATTGAYVVEELLMLRPNREPAELQFSRSIQENQAAPL